MHPYVHTICMLTISVPFSTKENEKISLSLAWLIKLCLLLLVVGMHKRVNTHRCTLLCSTAEGLAQPTQESGTLLHSTSRNSHYSLTHILHVVGGCVCL